MKADTTHPSPLYVETARSIEASILRGDWLPGQKLPPLADMATRFGVSRTVIREACSMLVGSGLLELRHGDGTYVRQFPEEVFSRPVHAALLLASSDARSLIETGLWLEQGIASVAAVRRTESQLAGLASALYAMTDGETDLATLLYGEYEFHMGMAAATANQIAENLLRILYHPLSGVLRVIGLDGALREEVVSLHRALYDSIACMDAVSAQRQVALYRQLLQERAYLLKNFKLGSDSLGQQPGTAGG
jgi:GntR family transcriptional repressor for pyruvate dehydrogenase complex